MLDHYPIDASSVALILESSSQEFRNHNADQDVVRPGWTCAMKRLEITLVLDSAKSGLSRRTAIVHDSLLFQEHETSAPSHLSIHVNVTTGDNFFIL
jgi:hypothetical protein